MGLIKSCDNDDFYHVSGASRDAPHTETATVAVDGLREFPLVLCCDGGDAAVMRDV